MDCRFNKKRLITLIEKISSLKDKICIYNLDAEDFIIQVKQKNSFYFIDPPYFCKGKQLYTNFFKPEDHLSLFKTIQNNLKNRSWIVRFHVTSHFFQHFTITTYRCTCSCSKHISCYGSGSACTKCFLSVVL